VCGERIAECPKNHSDSGEIPEVNFCQSQGCEDCFVEEEMMKLFIITDPLSGTDYSTITLLPVHTCRTLLD